MTDPLNEAYRLERELAEERAARLKAEAERDEARVDRDFFDAERIKVVEELDEALALLARAREAHKRVMGARDEAIEADKMVMHAHHLHAWLDDLSRLLA